MQCPCFVRKNNIVYGRDSFLNDSQLNYDIGVSSCGSSDMRYNHEKRQVFVAIHMKKILVWHSMSGRTPAVFLQKIIIFSQ